MKLIAIIVLILLFINYIETDKNIKGFLQRCTSNCNKKYCNISITCRPVNRTSKLSTMEINFHPGVKMEAPLNLEMNFYKKFAVVYRPFMIKVKEELCRLLLLKNHPFFQIHDDIEFAGNLLAPCPLTGRRYLTPWISDYSKIRIPLVPAGEWIIDHIITKNINGLEERLVEWADYYEITPTSATEF